jgi:hypothetical protein
MNQAYIKSWLDIAQSDIKSCKVLFENKLYSESFYHFQQASEKGMKAYAFLYGFHNKESDAFKTSHYTLQIFIDTISSELKTDTEEQELFVEESMEKLGLSESLKILKEYKSLMPNRKDVVNPSLELIDEALNQLKEFKNIRLYFRKDFEEKMSENLMTYSNTFKEINANVGNELEQSFEELKKYPEFIKAYMKLSVRHQYILLTLYHCAFFTNNHNNFSRYPGKDFNPKQFYNLRRPIVRKVPALLYHLQLAIKRMKKDNLNMSVNTF